jgi:F-type H+-transporting ATPase subunit a
VLALDFPPINEILRWRDLIPAIGFNKISLIVVLAVVISVVVFLMAVRRDPMKPPTGVRNFAEVLVEFIEQQIIMPTIGRSGLGWTPFLLTLFVFIFLCNIPGIIPILQMPATARLAIPLFLSVVVWLVFIGAGLKHQGVGYFTHLVWPPGVPVALKPLVGLIELVSTLLVRPFSLTIRLAANLLAGHILLVTFAVLAQELVKSDTIALKPVAILPWLMLVFITAFEVLVAFLQAYIFVILTAVYIGTSVHPEH